jgi:Uma2 family endonuclease
MMGSIKYTSADLELLPDIEGVRYEIIEGDLFVSKTPHAYHQYTCNRFGAELDHWDQRTGVGVTLVGPGLIFSPDNDVIPDVVWISRERLRLTLDDAGHLRAAPELVIEVLSPGTVNERRDLELKLSLYSRQGVREYWIADWRLRTVRVYRRQDAALQLVATLADDDVLTSPLLPGFSCPISSLWAPDFGG